MKHLNKITIPAKAESLLETEQKIGVLGGGVQLVSVIFQVLGEIRDFFNPEEAGGE